MNLESYINTLDTAQQQTAFGLLWKRISANPQSMSSPNWHGEVLAYREANPSDGPKMTVSEAKAEVKRIVDARRNS
jgi:hypothetical protein